MEPGAGRLYHRRHWTSRMEDAEDEGLGIDRPVSDRIRNRLRQATMALLLELVATGSITRRAVG